MHVPHAISIETNPCYTISALLQTAVVAGWTGDAWSLDCSPPASTLTVISLIYGLDTSIEHSCAATVQLKLLFHKEGDAAESVQGMDDDDDQNCVSQWVSCAPMRDPARIPARQVQPKIPFRFIQVCVWTCGLTWISPSTDLQIIASYSTRARPAPSNMPNHTSSQLLLLLKTY